MSADPAIESGLFKLQAWELLRFEQKPTSHPASAEIIEDVQRPVHSTRTSLDVSEENLFASDPVSRRDEDYADLTRAFVGLTDLPTHPLDRLGRYESSLWRQARQAIRALQSLGRTRANREARFGRRRAW